MVVDNLNVDLVGATSGVASVVSDVFFWTIIIGLFAGLVFFVSFQMLFKYKVRVRKVRSNGQSIIIDDKARLFKDNKGGVWWKTKKTKLKLKEPPVSAIGVDGRGKEVAELYLFEDGKTAWRNNTFDLDKLEELKASINNPNGIMDAMSSEERSLLTTEYIESENYKKKTITDLIRDAAPYLMLLMIFTLFFLFWDRAISPSVELAELMRSSTSDFRQSMEILRDVVQNTETIPLEGVPN